MGQIRNLPMHKRFPVMAEGLELMHEHIECLHRDFETLYQQGRLRSAAILRAFADEEAAKAMILLDVARAGWSNHERVQRLFDAIYDHLSRGLYVWAYDGHPASMQEVREYVDVMCQQRYLDGPNSFDWIFRNRIKSSREDLLYVDYVETEDGPYWNSPATQEPAFAGSSNASDIVRLTLALGRLGLLSLEGLKVTHKTWRGQDITDDTHWQQIRQLNRQVLEIYAAGHDVEQWLREDVSTVLDRWCFPLFEVDLKEKPATRQQLNELRNRLIMQQFGD